MTLFEMLAFLEANNWVQAGCIRLEYNPETKENILYRKTYQDKWIIWAKSKDRNMIVSTMCLYIKGPKCDKDYGSVEYDFSNVKCELTEEQQLALKIIKGDQISLDMAKDILKV